jgi:hypothetical protein
MYICTYVCIVCMYHRYVCMYIRMYARMYFYTCIFRLLWSEKDNALNLSECSFWTFSVRVTQTVQVASIVCVSGGVGQSHFRVYLCCI